MNIKQVEERTGMSRQNIRFYEKMELIHPTRNEANSYRDYSEDDIKKLEHIKLFRMLTIPIEEIARIFTSEISMEDAIKMQKENLIEKQRAMQGAIRICEQIEKECMSGKEISASDYLDRIEYEQHTKGGFGGFKEDYRKLIASEGIRQYSFVTDEDISTAENLNEVVCDSLGEEWNVKKEKEQFIAHHGNLTYQISQKKMRSNNKKHYMSTLVILTLEDPEEVVMPENRRMFLYTLHSVGKNIKTHKWRSILSVLFSFLIILLLAAYTGSIENMKEQQKILPKRTTIKGTVYNQNGKLDDGILIQDKYADAIAGSKYITKYMEKALFDVMLANDPNNLSTLCGMNEEMIYEKMDKLNLEWKDNYSLKSFNQSLNTCIVNQDFMNNHDLKIGDSITMNTFYYWLDPGKGLLIQQPLNMVTIEIVGTYQITDKNADVSLEQIVIPLESAKKWFQDEEKRYYANAISFYVKNPEEINRLKEELSNIGFKEIDTGLGINYTGDTVAIDDQSFIETSDRLSRSLNLLKSFSLLIFILIILIGAIVSYLITQSRRNEVTIMRMLGVRRNQIFISYVIEQIGLLCVGTVCSVIMVMIIGISCNIVMAEMLVLFVASYMTGVFVAIGQMIPSRKVRTDQSS